MPFDGVPLTAVLRCAKTCHVIAARPRRSRCACRCV